MAALDWKAKHTTHDGLASACVLQAALALVEALSTTKVVRVTASLAVCPRDHLHDAVCQAVGCLLPKIVFAGKVVFSTDPNLAHSVVTLFGL